LQPGDEFIRPSTRIVYVVIEVLLDGNYAMLTEVDGNHQILMSQEDLKSGKGWTH
jgi:hypothetical protein